MASAANSQPQASFRGYSSNTKILRPRFSAKMQAYFNEPGQLSRSDTRAAAKKIYKHLVRHRLRPDVLGARAVVPLSDVMVILFQHRDCLTATSHEGKRKWVQRRIKLLETLPCVQRMGGMLMLLEFNDVHGNDEQIDAHHARAAKTARSKSADRSRKYRTMVSGLSAADAVKCTSRPNKHIVTVVKQTLLTNKMPPEYNASTPKRPPRQPTQASGFVSPKAPPKRAAAVSANRAKQTQAYPSLASIRPQRGKTLAQPSWLLPVPRYAPRPDFDPRTHAKARRVYATGPLDASFVATMVRAHEKLDGLNYHALRKRQATNDTLFMACHLYVNSRHKVQKPVGWVMAMEQALRDGRARYA